MIGYKIFRDEAYLQDQPLNQGAMVIKEDGLSFYENPLHAVEGYGFQNFEGRLSKFTEVTPLGEVTSDNEHQSCAKTLKIARDLSVDKFIWACYSYVCSKISSREFSAFMGSITSTIENRSASGSAGEQSVAASTGNCSAATDIGCHSIAASTGGGSVALSSGSTAIAATTGELSAALSDGPLSVAAASEDFSIASASKSVSIAGSTGQKSLAVTESEDSVAASTGLDAFTLAKGPYSAAVSAGFSSTAQTTQSYSISAMSGENSLAICSGDYSVATGIGDYGKVIAEGEEDIAAAFGYNSLAKGNLGCWLVVAERDEEGHILSIASAKVDGDKIKPDVWYTAKDGQLVEAQNTSTTNYFS